VAIGLGQRLVHGSRSGVALCGGTGLLLTAFCQQPPRMSFPHRLAEKSSFENGLPDHYVHGTSIMEQPGEMIMSSIVSAAVAASSRSPLESMTDFWAGLSARFYRFLEELPERSEDVDPEVFKRVPVPV
jgi:hypothetical protein